MIRKDRIAALMQQLGIKQAELARRVGVSQPTIFRLINSNKTGSIRMHRIARELGTTPAYLMGESDDPSIDAAELALDYGDREALALFNGLTPADQKAVKQIMRSMAEHGAPSGTMHTPRLPFHGAAAAVPIVLTDQRGE